MIQIQISIEVGKESSGEHVGIVVNNFLREDANVKEAKIAKSIYAFLFKRLSSAMNAAKKKGAVVIMDEPGGEIDIEKLCEQTQERRSA